MKKTTSVRRKIKPETHVDNLLSPKGFGKMITTDNNILDLEDEFWAQHRYALITQDLFSYWMRSFPAMIQNSVDIVKCLQRCMLPALKSWRSYTDNPMEFANPSTALAWTHDTSTPHRLQTNGVAEKAVRWVKSETTSALIQSDLLEEWWHETVEYYCHLLNICDKMTDDTRHIKSDSMLLSKILRYRRERKSWVSRLHQCDVKINPKIVMDYSLSAGGRMDWWTVGDSLRQFSKLWIDVRRLHYKNQIVRAGLLQRSRSSYFFLWTRLFQTSGTKTLSISS